MKTAWTAMKTTNVSQKMKCQNGVDLRAPRREIRRSPIEIICPRLGKSARKADKNR